MSKKSEKTLFELVKSLTPAERKSLTLFINSYSDSDKKYFRLFELIDSQSNYDEKKIKQILNKENILTPLPKIKNYLSEIILKALRFHYSGKTIEGKIRDHFADLEICHSKGLITLRDRLLKKTKQLAFQNEKHESFLELLNTEWGYGVEQLKNKNILVEHREITAKVIAIRTYRSLIYSVHTLLKQGVIRDKTMKKQWLKIIHHPAMLAINEPSDFKANYYYHTIYSAYYEKLNDYSKCIHHQERLLKNMESRPDLLMENVASYVTMLNNFVAVLCANKELESAQEMMNKLILVQNWKLGLYDKKVLIRNIAFAYSNLLFGLVLVKKFDAGGRLAKEVEGFLSGHNTDLMAKTSLFVNLSIFYLNTGNYKEALIWNNNLLNESPENCREEDYAVSKIFNLIIHYELGHVELMPHLVRSTYRFLHRKKRLYKTEETLLRFIRNKFPAANSKKELIRFFKELKVELREITRDAFEARALEYFDFISWLDSKIQNRPFADIVSTVKSS